MNDQVKDLIYSAIFIIVIVLFAYAPSCRAGDVYMQLFSDKEVSAPIRSLQTDSRMTEEECQAHKAKIETPHRIGHRTTPSGWHVECIPVDYLDD